MFISLNLEEKKKFVKEKQLCWNFLSRVHKVKDCASTTKFRIDSCYKKHHTLLHDPPFKPVNLSNPVNPITNPFEENIQNHVLSSAFTNSAFLQIIPVILKSGETCIRTNALLDTGSDATLVRSDIANYLKLDGVTQNLKIANAVLNQKPLQSKLVSFEIYSDSQPDPFIIINASGSSKSERQILKVQSEFRQIILYPFERHTDSKTTPRGCHFNNQDRFSKTFNKSILLMLNDMQ